MTAFFKEVLPKQTQDKIYGFRRKLDIFPWQDVFFIYELDRAIKGGSYHRPISSSTDLNFRFVVQNPLWSSASICACKEACPIFLASLKNSLRCSEQQNFCLRLPVRLGRNGFLHDGRSHRNASVKTCTFVWEVILSCPIVSSCLPPFSRSECLCEPSGLSDSNYDRQFAARRVG